MKKQNGFTLIELVIVIIVLGILAATAVPKFINLQDDAKISAMNGVEAAVHSAANIVYSKSAIDGSEKVDETSVIKKPVVDDIKITYGFPTAAVGGIDKAVELSGFVAKFVDATPSIGSNISFVSATEYADEDLCLLYTEATASNTYKLEKGKVKTNACVVQAW
ncbi:type II secretion system protein [Moritella sp. 24]|uniref:type II secretion system protein n=1 Tax=Moritella sp. 24 TaxID=2746230 RepID=UPI001BACFA87|nr:type II secretion system protein [Moritella sp. 24]QUM78272.1 type II secretion system protein [Moritella sp. 24]